MEPRASFTKNQEVRRKKRTRVLLVVILFLIVLLAGAIGFLRRKNFQITAVSIVGTKALDSLVIQSAAYGHLNGSYAFVIPKTNALLFSKNDMNRFLESKFAGIESADTRFSARNQLEISIVEKKPVFTWCDQKCYFTDKSGVIYEEAPSFTPGVFISFSGVSAGSTIDPTGDPIRKRFASQSEFDRAVEAVTRLWNYPAHVIGMKFLSNADSTSSVSAGPGDIAIAVDMIKSVAVNPNAKLFVTQSQSADEVVRALDLVMAEKGFQAQLASAPKSLTYIDLRFDGKIYYKFGSGTPGAGAETSTAAPAASKSAPAKQSVKPTDKPAAKPSSAKKRN